MPSDTAMLPEQVISEDTELKATLNLGYEFKFRASIGQIRLDITFHGPTKEAILDTVRTLFGEGHPDWLVIESALTAQPADVDPSPDQQPQNSQEAQPPNDGGSVPLGSKDIPPSGTGELHGRPEQPGNREPSAGLPQTLDTNVDGRTQGSPDLNSVVDGGEGSKGILPPGDGS